MKEDIYDFVQGDDQTLIETSEQLMNRNDEVLHRLKLRCEKTISCQPL